MNRLKNYINGAWADSSSNETVDVHNPATQEVIATVPMEPQLKKIFKTRQLAHKELT